VDVNLWDYEMCTLVGTVAEPSSKDASRFGATALTFVSTLPYLAGESFLRQLSYGELPANEMTPYASFMQPDPIKVRSISGVSLNAHISSSSPPGTPR